MVEHGGAGKEQDDLPIGIGIMAEASLLDPAEEVEGVVGMAGAAENGEDEGLVEGSEGADGVLEAGGPGPPCHHVADGLVQLLFLLRGVLPARRRRGGAGILIGGARIAGRGGGWSEVGVG